MFFVLSLVAIFCKLVVLLGEKLEDNEISKNFLKGSHSFNIYMSRNIRCYILVIG
jgi:hypothetical protein